MRRTTPIPALVIRRVLAAAVTMLVLTFAVFTFVELSPQADPFIDGAHAASPEPEPALPVRYLRWLGGMSPITFSADAPIGLRVPDLGHSASRGRPVADVIAPALGVTLALNALALVLIYICAIPTGILAGARRGGWFDVLSGGAVVALWAMPTMWAGVLAIGFLASDAHLGWFPIAGVHDADAASFRFLPSFADAGGFRRGYLLDTLWHIALPVACLAYGGFAILAKQTRASVMENLHADHVRTAIAKGADRSGVLRRHVVRNSLVPIITLTGALIPQLVSGSVVVEQIFSIPGMGTLVLDAVMRRDTDLLMANVVVIGGITILALLLADIAVRLADPRTGDEA